MRHRMSPKVCCVAGVSGNGERRPLPLFNLLHTIGEIVPPAPALAVTAYVTAGSAHPLRSVYMLGSELGIDQLVNHPIVILIC